MAKSAYDGATTTQRFGAALWYLLMSAAVGAALRAGAVERNAVGGVGVALLLVVADGVAIWLDSDFLTLGMVPALVALPWLGFGVAWPIALLAVLAHWSAPAITARSKISWLPFHMVRGPMAFPVNVLNDMGKPRPVPRFTWSWVWWPAYAAAFLITLSTHPRPNATLWVGLLTAQAALGALLATTATEAGTLFVDGLLKPFVTSAASYGFLSPSTKVNEEVATALVADDRHSVVRDAGKIFIRSVLLMPVAMWVQGSTEGAVLILSLVWTAKDLSYYAVLWTRLVSVWSRYGEAKALHNETLARCLICRWTQTLGNN